MVNLWCILISVLNRTLFFFVQVLSKNILGLNLKKNRDAGIVNRIKIYRIKIHLSHNFVCVFRRRERLFIRSSRL